MHSRVFSKPTGVLILGDLVVMALVTITGFYSHGTVLHAGTRMLTTFLPLAVGWFAVAPMMGAYRLDNSSPKLQFWGPFWSMIVAAPLAALLRGLWLNSPILPVFVIVLGGIASLSILIWRALFFFVVYRGKVSNG